MPLNKIQNEIIVIILVTLVACQPTLVAPTPTLTSIPVAAPTLAARSTRPMQAVTVVAPTEGVRRPTPTRWPATILLTPGEGPPPGTLEPALLTQVALRSDGASVAADVSVFGWTVEGRPLTARRFGDGERILLLVGGMHGGWEANTVALVEQFAAHFEQHPDDVLFGMTLVLVPVVNADGLVFGRTPEGRFNANGVDLNRNWDCDWSPDAVWRRERVDPGPAAFSEPETKALSDFILGLRPTVALFFHSAANGVFAGSCRGDHGSAAMSAIFGEAGGYKYGHPFTSYAVSGAASEWADGLGIPSADVELSSWTDSEFDANLRGVMALQRWLVGLKP